MLVVRVPSNPLKSIEVWWPDCPERVYPFLRTSPVVAVAQCSDEVAGSLKSYAFRHKTFQTWMLDLSVPSEQLWRGIRAAARYDIRKGETLGADVLLNEHNSEAFQLINAFILRKRFRRPITEAEWARLLQFGDVFIVRQRGRAIAAQMVLADPPFRARLLLSATVNREDAQSRPFVGPLNKLLLWRMLEYYKDKGVRWFDMGGAVTNRMSPMYSISQFKRSFGGELLTENTLLLARNPVNRLILRGVVTARLWARSMVGLNA